VAAGDIPPVLVVAVDNSPARFDEYTHVADDLGGMVVGGHADAYADFLVDGVVPFIAERYPVATGPEATAVVGSSLGGLASLYLGWRHPDVFGWIGSLSGTVGWGTFGLDNPTIGALYLDARPNVSIYLDSGGSEGLGCPDGDTDNYCDNVALADLLRGLGWVDEVDLVYRWDPDAPHNEAAWAARVAPLLTQWRFAGG
jgi:pimeloyl-ACP methyl ester carboxylesterase